MIGPVLAEANRLSEQMVFAGGASLPLDTLDGYFIFGANGLIVVNSASRGPTVVGETACLPPSFPGGITRAFTWTITGSTYDLAPWVAPDWVDLGDPGACAPEEFQEFAFGP